MAAMLGYCALENIFNAVSSSYPYAVFVSPPKLHYVYIENLVSL